MDTMQSNRIPRYEHCEDCKHLIKISGAYLGSNLVKEMLDDGLEKEEHMLKVHRKVWIRKGRRGFWMTVREVTEQLERQQR